MIEVILYTRAGCHLCDDAKSLLSSLRDRFSLVITELDIDGDPALRERYNESVPVIAIDGRERFRGLVNGPMLIRELHAAVRMRRRP